MSRIADLVAELCPDGVRFRRPGDIGKWYGGGTRSKRNSEYRTDGTIPWLSPKDMGPRVIVCTNDYITDAAVAESATRLVLAASVAVIVRSSILDRVLPTALVPIAVTLNQDMKAVVTSKEIISHYLFHALSSSGPKLLSLYRNRGGSVTSIDVPNLMNYRVPVSSLEVQREIIRVLGTFTTQEAELESCRAQYGYYRDSLTVCGASVPRIPLGKLGVYSADSMGSQRLTSKTEMLSLLFTETFSAILP
jgi:restriction endonuclease S subunit